jgi:two-component system chemotaxis response regulator CheY
MKVLVVDDSKTMRGILRKILSALDGAQFVEAADGLEALAALAAEPGGFGLILVDWNMPNMDGLTLVRQFREKDKRTPVVMATTEAEKDRVVEAIRTGVTNYVVKPFTPRMLVDKVKQTLDRSNGPGRSVAAT